MIFYIENEIAILTSCFLKKLIGERKVIVYFLWEKSYCICSEYNVRNWGLVYLCDTLRMLSREIFIALREFVIQ